GAVLAVACEARQLRRTHRLPMKLPAMVRTASGHAHRTKMHDLSLGGASVEWNHPPPQGETVGLGLVVGSDEHWLPGRIVGHGDGRLRMAFDGLSLRQESDLVHTLFGRPDAWIDWEHGRPEDRPLASLRTLAHKSVRGMRSAMAAQPRVMGGSVLA